MEPIVWLGLALWLVLLLLLGIVFARTARRMTELAGRTRELTAYQSAIAGLEAQSSAAANSLIGPLDEIRRRSGDPALVAELVAPAQAEVRAGIEAARALVTPAGLADRTAAVLAELQRMDRSLDLIDHALSGLVGIRGPRELEIQTTLKRGSLNLRHARDAIAFVAGNVRALTPADLRPGMAPPPLAMRATPVPVWDPDSGGRAEEIGTEPIM